MKKYYCDDCGVELNEGEGSVFTCCETCWNKHYKKTDEQSEVRVEAKVKPEIAEETLKEILEMIRREFLFATENYPEQYHSMVRIKIERLVVEINKKYNSNLSE